MTNKNLIVRTSPFKVNFDFMDPLFFFSYVESHAAGRKQYPLGTIATMTFWTAQRACVCYSAQKVWFSLKLCLKHTLKGLSLLVKTKTKQSPNQNTVTAIPSSLIRQSFHRTLTLRSRNTWLWSLQFTFPRLFQKMC